MKMEMIIRLSEARVSKRFLVEPVILLSVLDLSHEQMVLIIMSLWVKRVSIIIYEEMIMSLSERRLLFLMLLLILPSLEIRYWVLMQDFGWIVVQIIISS